MSKHNLALLDRAVTAAVAHELGEGDHDHDALKALGVEPQRKRNVAGIRVISNAARDASYDPNAARLLDNLLRYRTDRQLVTDKLKRVGVEPIAILPRTAWDRICVESQLYRFIPRGDTVRMDISKLVEEATKKAREEELQIGQQSSGNWKIPLALLALLAPAAHFHSIGWLFPFPLIAMWAAYAYSGEKLHWSERQALEAKHLRTLVEEHEKAGNIVAMLWPNCIEPTAKKKAEDNAEVRIALPEAPPEVVERVLAVERARLPLHVAVVAEAISFKEPIVDAVLRSRTKYWEEIAQLEALKRDPIHYVVEGSAVAIIDQYGEFPIEQAVINQVINSEHLA